MSAPFTQVEIQAEIDFYKDAMRKAATNQEHEYGQGQVGDFRLKRGALEQIESALKFWLDMMEEYYPDAFSVQPQIELTQVGFLSG